MRRQLLTPLLWLFVLVVVGIVESLQATLRVVVRLGFKSVLAIATLVVLWRSDNVAAIQLADYPVRPLGHMIELSVAFAAALAVLYHGLRSRVRQRLWRLLRSRVLGG